MWAGGGGEEEGIEEVVRRMKARQYCTSANPQNTYWTRCTPRGPAEQIPDPGSRPLHLFFFEKNKKRDKYIASDGMAWMDSGKLGVINVFIKPSITCIELC